MIKIKLLNAFVIGLIIIYVLHFSGNIYITFFTELTSQFDDLYKEFIFGSYTQYVSLVLSIITFFGLLFIKSGLGKIIKEGLFNSDSAIQFKMGGKLFLLSGSLSLIFNIMLFYGSIEIALLALMGQDFLFIIIGFSLYIIADILQNGTLLKQENELTI
jgi:hypothetical protein